MKKVLISVLAATIVLLAIACSDEAEVVEVNPFIKSGDSQLMIDGMNTLPWKDNESYGKMANYCKVLGEEYYVMKNTYAYDFIGIAEDLINLHELRMHTIESSEDLVDVKIEGSLKTTEAIDDAEKFKEAFAMLEGDEIVLSGTAENFKVVARNSKSDMVVVFMVNGDFTFTTPTIPGVEYEIELSTNKTLTVCFGFSDDLSLVSESADVVFENCTKKEIFELSVGKVGYDADGFVPKYIFGDGARFAARYGLATFGFLANPNSSDFLFNNYAYAYDRDRSTCLNGTLYMGLDNNDSTRALHLGAKLTGETDITDPTFTTFADYLQNSVYMNEKVLLDPHKGYGVFYVLQNTLEYYPELEDI